MGMPIHMRYGEGHSLGNRSRSYSRGISHDIKKIHRNMWKTKGIHLGQCSSIQTLQINDQHCMRENCERQNSSHTSTEEE